MRVAIRALTTLPRSKSVQTSVQPPAELRSIHPAPPTSMQFKGKTITIQGLNNPLRGDAANFDKHVQAGAAMVSSRHQGW